MTPREVVARHTSRELSEWRLFFAYEPQGWEGLNLAQANIAQTIVNMTPRGKNAERYELKDALLGQRDSPEREWVEVSPTDALKMLRGR